MTTTILSCSFVALVFSAASSAQTNPPAGKTVILQVQNAVAATREGHQALAALDAKFAARKAEFEKRQTELDTIQQQLQKGAATMSEDAQRKMARDIDRKTKSLNYDMDAAQTEYQQEEADTIQAIGKKFRGVVDKYARDNGFALVIDVSNPQTSAFWWGSALDITNEVVRAYDAAYPAAVAAGK